MARVVTAQHALAKSIVRRLRAAGFEAYLAGGCVRDMLLGIEPKDFDVATAATPDQVESVFSRTTPVGRAFGVILVHDEETPQIHAEVATFRSDGSYSDGRRPDSVTFSSAKEDALRRDFTINGMFMDPESGEVMDFVGGRADLESRVVRTIGDPRKRFAEDHLRLLRGIRFACRYAFAIDPETTSAMAEMAETLRDVSAERIRQELDGMVTGPARGRALMEMASTGLLGVALPELAESPEGPGAVARTAGLLDMANRDTLTPVLAWSLLLHACAGAHDADGRLPNGAPAAAKSAMRRLAHSSAMMHGVESALAAVGGALALREAPLAQVKRFLRGAAVAEALEIDRLLAVWDRSLGVPGTDQRLATSGAAMRALVHYSRISGPGGLHPEPLLDGKAVIALGVPPGPKVGEVMRMLEDATLGETISTREQAEAMVKNWLAGGTA